MNERLLRSIELFGDLELSDKIADARKELISHLKDKGYEILSITEDKLSTSLGLTSMSRTKKMNAKDLNFFLTQLSTYVKSGIPLVDSMEILSRQTKSKTVQSIYRKIVFELTKVTSVLLLILN